MPPRGALPDGLRLGMLVRIQPLIGPALSFFLRDAVTLLDLAYKLLAFAIDLGQIVIGKLAELFFHVTFHLLPLSCDLIPIHNENHLSGFAGKQPAL